MASGHLAAPMDTGNATASHSRAALFVCTAAGGRTAVSRDTVNALGRRRTRSTTGLLEDTEPSEHAPGESGRRVPRHRLDHPVGLAGDLQCLDPGEQRGPEVQLGDADRLACRAPARRAGRCRPRRRDADGCVGLRSWQGVTSRRCSRADERPISWTLHLPSGEQRAPVDARPAGLAQRGLQLRKVARGHDPHQDGEGSR